MYEKVKIENNDQSYGKHGPLETPEVKSGG